MTVLVGCEVQNRKYSLKKVMRFWFVGELSRKSTDLGHQRALKMTHCLAITSFFWMLYFNLSELLFFICVIKVTPLS